MYLIPFAVSVSRSSFVAPCQKCQCAPSIAPFSISSLSLRICRHIELVSLTSMPAFDSWAIPFNNRSMYRGPSLVINAFAGFVPAPPSNTSRRSSPHLPKRLAPVGTRPVGPLTGATLGCYAKSRLLLSFKLHKRLASLVEIPFSIAFIASNCPAISRCISG